MVKERFNINVLNYFLLELKEDYKNNIITKSDKNYFISQLANELIMAGYESCALSILRTEKR